MFLISCTVPILMNNYNCEHEKKEKCLPGLWFVHFVYKCNAGDTIMLGPFPYSNGLGLKGHTLHVDIYIEREYYIM